MATEKHVPWSFSRLPTLAFLQLLLSDSDTLVLSLRCVWWRPPKTRRAERFRFLWPYFQPLCSSRLTLLTSSCLYLLTRQSRAFTQTLSSGNLHNVSTCKGKFCQKQTFFLLWSRALLPMNHHRVDSSHSLLQRGMLSHRMGKTVIMEKMNVLDRVDKKEAFSKVE